MTTLPPEIDFKVDKAASPDRMNRATAHIDARIRALETYKPNLDALIANLQQFGLDRISEAVIPIVQRLSTVEELGFLNAPIQEGTTAQFKLGSVSVTIAENRRSVFTPSPWVMLLSDLNPTDYVLGRRIAYDQTTGVLNLNITNQWGTNSVFGDVTVWGVAGGALSALESAAQVAADRAAVAADKATVVSAASTISSATINAVAAAATASNEANNAAESAADCAAIVATIAGGPVASINGKTGVVSLTPEDLGFTIDPGTF